MGAMSYATQPGAGDGAAALRRPPVAATPSAVSAMGRAGGGDSAYVEDHRAVQDAAVKVQQCTADMRKETNHLGTVSLISDVKASRRKAHEVLQTAKTTLEEAKRLLEGLAINGGTMSSEQKMRRLTQQKLSENLTRAAASLEAAWRAYEEKALAREHQLSAEAASGVYGVNGRPGLAGVELPMRADRGLRLHLEMQEAAEEAAIETHGEIVDEYVEEISTLQRDIHSLQQTFHELAHHIQGQGDMLDNIEVNMSRSASNTEGASEQLVQTNQTHRRSTRLLYCLMVLAVCLAIATIIVAVRKSEGH